MICKVFSETNYIISFSVKGLLSFSTFFGVSALLSEVFELKAIWFCSSFGEFSTVLIKLLIEFIGVWTLSSFSFLTSSFASNIYLHCYAIIFFIVWKDGAGVRVSEVTLSSSSLTLILFIVFGLETAGLDYISSLETPCLLITLLSSCTLTLWLPFFIDSNIRRKLLIVPVTYTSLSITPLTSSSLSNQDFPSALWILWLKSSYLELFKPRRWGSPESLTFKKLSLGSKACSLTWIIYLSFMFS